MRITLFRDLKEENWFSMERYATALLSAMRNFHRFKESPLVDFSIFNFQTEDFVVEKQNVTPSSAFNLYYTRYFYYPLKARGQQGDVNHIVDHSYGHLVYALDPKRTVVTCHDLNPLKHEDSWVNLRLFKYGLGGLKRAAKIISDSESTKRDLIKFLKIDSSKIAVIPLGVEEKFRVMDDQCRLDGIRGKFDLSSRPARRQAGRKIILHVGGSAYNKNIEGIISAISKIKNQSAIGGSNFCFMKVGSGFTEPQKILIKDLNLENNVKFLGQVSEGDLVALYNLADVFIFPSFYEGFGLPVLEAMACGTPVVTSNVSSMPEVTSNVAISVDPRNVEDIASGIGQVFDSNTAQYQSWVQRGLEQAKKFTWQKTAEETLKVYKEVYSNL